MSNENFSRPNATDVLEANADLTGKEGYAIKLSSDKAATETSDTVTTTYGVLTHAGKSGENVTVALMESGQVVYVKLGATPGTVNRGTKLGTHTDGTFKATALTKNYYVRALESGAANEQIEGQLIASGVTS